MRVSSFLNSCCTQVMAAKVSAAPARRPIMLSLRVAMSRSGRPRSRTPAWCGSSRRHRRKSSLTALQSQDAEGTVSYRATADGHNLELLIDAQACRDSMSGEYFAYAARAVLDGKEFKGCARVGK